MEIKETEKEEGSFADIFIDKSTGRAYKLFKSYQHPNIDKFDYGELEFNAYRKRVFESEKKAYQITQNCKLLNDRSLFPIFYGTPTITKVYNSKGADVSNNYLLDCCLDLEYIQGENNKLGLIDKNDFNTTYSINIDAIIREMKDAGIGFTIDMSIISTIKTFKLIDFAIVDFCTLQPEFYNKQKPE